MKNIINTKKPSYKIMACILAATAFSASLSVAAEASENCTAKEEVIYVNLNTDGTVDEINVVNILQPDNNGKITDFGEYTNLRNMTTTDDIKYSSGKITVETKADSLYYEGKLENKQIPWNIELHYFMDGKEYSAQEIAGRKGKIKIEISISENKSYKGNFFKGYALQASLQLDSKKFKNITAENATIANIGSEKQISYTILPNKGMTGSITADATDFELDGFSINAIPLSLNIEIDNSELSNEVNKLETGVNKLNDGAVKVNDGATKLDDNVKNNLNDGVNSLIDGASVIDSGTQNLLNGGNSLNSGISNLQSGANTLDVGINSLKDGIEKIQGGLETLNGKSETLTSGSAQFKTALIKIQTALQGVVLNTEELSALTSASSEIKMGVDSIADGVEKLQKNVSFDSYSNMLMQKGLDVKALKTNNSNVINQINNSINDLSSKIEFLEQQGADTSQMREQIDQLSDIAALLTVNNLNIDATEQYLNSVNDNIADLLEGVLKLQKSYEIFNNKIVELADTLESMLLKMVNLSDAINMLVTEYNKIDIGIVNYTEGVADIVSGYSQLSVGVNRLAEGSKNLNNGINSLSLGAAELTNGISAIGGGIGSLLTGSEEFGNGVSSLTDGTAKLYSGTSELKNGTSALKKETDGMNEKINNKIDSLIEDMTGADIEINSFVSEKNTQVKKVQFVIKTPSVKVTTNDIVPEEKEKTLSIWQKFLHLFKREV